MSSTRRTRIRVPTRMIQGGFDTKFETDSYDVQLHGILTPEDYTMIIDRVNQKTKPARSNVIDKGLLITGPLLVPLALWGARHSMQARRRKRLLDEAIREFNESHPEHWMRWNRGGPESFLTIERREPVTALTIPQPQPEAPGDVAAVPLRSAGAAGLAVAEARLVV
jgi:hypothetical protein